MKTKYTVCLRRCLSLSLLSLLTLAGAALSAVPPRIIASEPMIVRMRTPEARIPVRLSSVKVQASLAGSVAHTRIEMVFYNPNERVLEGELQFPLTEGQMVSGFALDIDGTLRPAVPVEKATGQEIFEDVTRARVDPALLEKTQGNNYKLRVYPLPARGSRRVVLELDEMLSAGGDKNRKTYRLPLQFGSAVESLEVTVKGSGIAKPRRGAAMRGRLGSEPLSVSYMREGDSDIAQVQFTRRDYKGKGLLEIDFAKPEKPLVVTETRGDQTYFYAEVKLPSAKAVPRITPKSIGLIWDASGSGEAREHGREFALLEAYFKSLRNVEVTLLIARERAEAPRQFSVRNGDWNALREVLEGVTYDGATSAAALSTGMQTELNLLFSDGLANYGDNEFHNDNVPMFTVNAAAVNDLPRLRAWAERRGGCLLDLLSISAAQAVDGLQNIPATLEMVHSDGASELVHTMIRGESGTVAVAGILNNPQADIQLYWAWSYSREPRLRQTLHVVNQPGNALAANRWAAIKLERLDADYAGNRAAILRLGKQFGMVTRETSLIVLDRVQDYVRYEITPPESLRAEYERLLAEKRQSADTDRQHHVDEIAGRFAQKISWWERVFPKGAKPQPKPAAKADSSDGSPSWFSRLLGASGAAQERAASAQAEAVPAPMARVGSAAPTAAASAPESDSAPAAGIRLKKWEPDAPYARRLREAAPEQMYAVYLDERPAYAASSAFFLDAADILIERGEVDLGLRVLSNLAEMNLENRQILRILAYRLLQAKRVELALPILKQVLALSPNEPQSWRDLGLAYAEDGQYQKSINHLWEVISRPWHGRFPDIELVALAEMNAIIARVPKENVIDTRRIDARLLRNLPLDIRAVLSWDSDNSDIDLWVTDPNNEKVYYAHRLGYQGGAMSRDFTGGYGPEEFSLRDAKPGTYKVEAHFYGNRQQIVAGATTLMLRFSTGFGTLNQKDENIILRLTGQGSDVEVGTFEIKR